MVALGAVLSQLHGGIEKLVEFASRSHTPAEQKYPVVEREALGIRTLASLIYGKAYTMPTDHQALTTLFTTTG